MGHPTDVVAMYNTSSGPRVIPVFLLHHLIPLVTSGKKPRRLTYQDYRNSSYTGELNAPLLLLAKAHMGSVEIRRVRPREASFAESLG